MRKHFITIIIAGLLISLAGCSTKDNLDTVATSQATPNVTVTSQVPDELDVKYAKYSHNYLVGFDYSSYDDVFGMAPVLICKVRYDKKLETGFKNDNDETVEIRTYDLTDEQYDNIILAVNFEHIFTMDPMVSDLEDVCDGGSAWLILYDQNDEVLKKIGGFCPTNTEFNDIRRVLFDNIPETFINDYNVYCQNIKDGIGTEQDKSIYDIENAITDPTLIGIIQGDIKPAKVVYGRGGEAGYEQYESTDDMMIKCMIDGLRLLQLSDVLYEDVPYTADGNEDVIFCLEDGTQVSIAFDDKSYVHTEQNNQSVVYVFSNVDKLSEFEDMIVTGKK